MSPNTSLVRGGSSAVRGRLESYPDLLQAHFGDRLFVSDREAAPRTNSPTLAGIAVSDHGAFPTKCSKQLCMAASPPVGVTAANGSALFRANGIISPRQ
jgi:hypothetical protein